VLEKDGGGFGNEGVEVSEAKVRLIEGSSKLATCSSDICWDGFKLLAELARGEVTILLVEGGEDISSKVLGVVHG
jgi:hypothetical protein